MYYIQECISYKSLFGSVYRFWKLCESDFIIMVEVENLKAVSNLSLSQSWIDFHN